MDFWYWPDSAVFVCDGFLAWFNSQGRLIGPDGRRIQQPYADYLANGPWLPDVPAEVVDELKAAVTAKLEGKSRPVSATASQRWRPAPTSCTEWAYWGPYGVRFEGDHLVWYEREGEVRFASGGSCDQSFADFIKNGPHMENVQASVAAEVAAAVLARVEAANNQA